MTISKADYAEIIARGLTVRGFGILQRLDRGLTIRATGIPGLLLWSDGKIENKSELDTLADKGLIAIED
jgi:hypothetical protein